MADIIRKRLTGREEGFTLIELLVVIVILGILMAIAVPSYMGFRDRAQRSAAQANVRAAIPSAEAYYQDNNNYTEMTEVIIKTGAVGVDPYDTGLASSVLMNGTDDTYCISDQQGDWIARVDGPGGSIDAKKDGTVLACS